MELKLDPCAVYVKVDSENHITAINSSVFLPDVTGWVKIDEGYGDKYYHAQGNYLPKRILTDSKVYRYRLAGLIPVECTEEEIAAQEALLPEPVIVDPLTRVYDELEAAYQEGVNSI